jgi:uncharacterized membrane protein YidH (DUF202 family)
LETPVESAHRAERVEYHTSRFGSGIEVETHLSWCQSRMSTERTLMACVRFATTLIALGFTIAEYVAHAASTGGLASTVRPETARFFSLGMIAAGTVLLIAALYQYRVLITFLWSSDYRPVAGFGGDETQTHATVAITILLVLVGIFALGAVLLRIE